MAPNYFYPLTASWIDDSFKKLNVYKRLCHCPSVGRSKSAIISEKKISEHPWFLSSFLVIKLVVEFLSSQRPFPSQKHFFNISLKNNEKIKF